MLGIKCLCGLVIMFLVTASFPVNSYAQSADSDLDGSVVRRKVEYFLWLPPARHVKGDYEADHCWATKRFLDTKIDKLNEICDFTIVDTNNPNDRYFDGKVIQSHSLRIGGVWVGHSNAELQDKEGFYKHLRYLILLDKFLLENERINVVSSYRNKNCIFYETETYREFPFGKIKCKTLSLNPVLEAYPPFEPITYLSRYSYFSPSLSVNVEVNRNKFQRTTQKRLDFLRRLDYNTGVLSSVIEKEEARLGRILSNEPEFEP